jgi:hypothetical protein
LRIANLVARRNLQTFFEIGRKSSHFGHIQGLHC